MKPLLIVVYSSVAAVILGVFCVWGFLNCTTGLAVIIGRM